MENLKTGFSLTELMIALLISTILALAMYRFSSKFYIKTAHSTKLTLNQQQAGKAMERMDSEIRNSISINSKFSVLGNIQTASPPANCGTTFTVNYPPHPNFFSHGLAALPARNVDDIDNGGILTLADPSDQSLLVDADGNPLDKESDAYRIVFLPLDSDPVMVVNFDLDGSSLPRTREIYVNDASAFKAGDYAILFDSSRREFFRITDVDIANNKITRGNTSLWNISFVFDGNFPPFLQNKSFVQRVEIATYAYDAENLTVDRDNHMSDDNFEVGMTTVPGPASRIKNFVPIAESVQQLHVNYSLFAWDLHPPIVPPATVAPPPRANKNVLVTERFPAALQMTDKCPNQMGYPLFRHVNIEIVLNSVSKDETQETLVSRSSRSEGLGQKEGGGDDPPPGLTDPATASGGASGPSPTYTPIPGSSW